jgi:hypothetical protein
MTFRIQPGEVLDLRRQFARRAKARGWLRDDLALRKQQAAPSSAAERKEAAAKLSSWQRESVLSGTRPGLMRIGMPTAERAEWDAFWADVKETIAEARKPPPAPKAK